MNFLDALQTSSTGLAAQRLRMNLISSNLANISTTRTAKGGPYQRKEPVFEAVQKEGGFHDQLSSKMRSGVTDVKVSEILEDGRPPLTRYDPHHPDADKKGYVAMPNINVMEEMVNMMMASRSYEANVAAVNATKKMALKALEIGK